MAGFSCCFFFHFNSIFPFPKRRNFPFQMVEISLSKTSKFPFPKRQNFPFQKVEISLSKPSKNPSFHHCTIKINYSKHINLLQVYHKQQHGKKALYNVKKRNFSHVPTIFIISFYNSFQPFTNFHTQKNIFIFSKQINFNLMRVINYCKKYFYVI
jgi:hypothetical protein